MIETTGDLLWMQNWNLGVPQVIELVYVYEGV